MKKYAFILLAALTVMNVFTTCTANESPESEITEVKIVIIRVTIDDGIRSCMSLTDDVTNCIVKVIGSKMTF